MLYVLTDKMELILIMLSALWGDLEVKMTCYRLLVHDKGFTNVHYSHRGDLALSWGARRADVRQNP